MKDFIEKLIERLEINKNCKHNFAIDELLKNGHTPYAEVLMIEEETYENSIAIVKELAEEYKGGWIPCSSGNFPTEEVLVCIEDGTMDFDIYDFAYEDWKYNSKHHKNKVVAWMPLPEPYQPRRRKSNYKIDHAY